MMLAKDRTQKHESHHILTKAMYATSILIQSEISIVLCLTAMSHARIFGIPGTVIGTAALPLQVAPGWGTAVITTLFPQTSVQVECQVADPWVGYDPWSDRPWWLKVYVWSSGMEGWVADPVDLNSPHIGCRHERHGRCHVPFCDLHPLRMRSSRHRNTQVWKLWKP